jgi:hypothetical protein
MCLNKKEIRLEKTAIKPIDIFELPTILIDNIFFYCKFSLNLRVINRKFSEYILKNIHSIKLKDEIDT